MKKDPPSPSESSDSDSDSSSSSISAQGETPIIDNDKNGGSDKDNGSGSSSKSREYYLSRAVMMADRVRSKVTNYPHHHNVLRRTEPPPLLPYGLMEGGLVGLLTLGATVPARRLVKKLVSTGPAVRIRPLVEMVVTAGQLMLSAQTAIYTGVLVGSRNWLETLTDLASANPRTEGRSRNTSTSSSSSSSSSPSNDSHQTNHHYHKSILADDLCREPIIEKLLLDQSTTTIPSVLSGNDPVVSLEVHLPPKGGEEPSSSRLVATTNDNKQQQQQQQHETVSLMEWIKDPQKVVTDELFRAVALCRLRRRSTTNDNNTKPVDGEDGSNSRR